MAVSEPFHSGAILDRMMNQLQPKSPGLAGSLPGKDTRFGMAVDTALSF